MHRRSTRHASCLTPFLLAVAALLAACGGDDPEPVGVDPAAANLARERAAAWFQKPADDSGLEHARRELAPLVENESAPVEDLVRAAAVEFAMLDAERAKGFVDRALAKDAQDPAANYIAGQLAYEEGDVEACIVHLERTLAVAPDDLPTRLRLATAYEDLEREDDALAMYQGILDQGIERAGDWYIAALYRQIQLYYVTGDEDRAQQLAEVRRELDAAGFEAPSQKVVLRGNFGVLRPPARQGTTPGANRANPRWSRVAVDAGLPAGANARVIDRDLDGDGVRERLIVSAGGGLSRLVEEGDGLVARNLVPGPLEVLRTLDLDNDGDLDVVGFEGGVAHFWLQDDGAFARRAIPCPTLPQRPHDVAVVDFDHEGDVDLLLVGDFGARLWRNDGAWVEGGSFQDASELAGLPDDRAFRWCITEDFDTDQDVDLLLVNESSAYLADSLRAGRFADVSDRLPAGARWNGRPVVADVDGDARPDLVSVGAPCKLWRQRADGGFAGEDLRLSDAGPLLVADLDGDNAYDLIGAAGIEFAVGQLTRDPLAVDASNAALSIGVAADGTAMELAALENDGDAWTLVTGRFDPADERGRPLRLVGTRDNHRAVGATIEVRAGGSYRRVYWRGEPLVIAAAGHAELDVLRIVWANGVVQPYLDVPLTPPADEPALLSYEQNAALVGSCPFLYAWNGETFGFISDVLGATPLGLPIAPGVYVQPDHDEYVLVTGEQLVPDERGELVLQFTEELREVTYLDRAKLIAVDHPATGEVFPNELFCFPPFPEHHLHSVETSHAPVRAVGSDGRDWSAELATTDDRHAVPFSPLPQQFAGLAEPWFLELEFDADACRDAEALRLVMTGWFNWSDSSANVAAARTPGVDFVPPLFQVPDGEGGWRPVGPPHGFPAGKTKTMVVDAGAWLDREDPRVRVACTLQLYWDRISLATCADDAPRVRTELEPTRADLWLRGFSDPIETDAADQPERFEWDRIARHPRWNQHPGMYTKLGDCVPLLGEADDRFVILGAGDCLTLAFDASALPALPEGWRRDYLVYLDGWAKDRDHNATNVLEVEPMPFHGMSGFPYGPDESFPDGEEHRRWRREWNTRPAHRWIAPPSPRRVAEAVEGL